jgi:predicted DNA-binding antitoxin AbrB/MazE fold protein
MSETIEAIYEKGVFRPVNPVDLPEGTRVFIETDTFPIEKEAQLREQLIADGASPEDADKILENFRRLWSSYDTLTEDQKKALEQSRLDQENFFEHRPSP